MEAGAVTNHMLFNVFLFSYQHAMRCTAGNTRQPSLSRDSWQQKIQALVEIDRQK